MRQQTVKNISRLALAVLAAALFICQAAPVGAMSQAQRDVYDLGINYFDVNPTTACTSSAGSINLIGTDNQSKVWNFLISNGLKPFQAAGIFGNLMQESGGQLNPKALEHNGDGVDGYTGHGIVQWSWVRWRTDYGKAGPRSSTTYDGYPGGSPTARAADTAKTADLTDFGSYPPKTPLDPKTLLGFAAEKGAPWYDLGVQAEFILWEAGPGGNRAGILDKVKATNTVEEATRVWGEDYEGFGDDSMSTRMKYANAALSQYGNNAPVPLDDSSSTSTSSGCSTTAGVDCSSFSPVSSGAADTSQLRQTVVCLAENELKTVWTPLPATPRMQYTKYSDGAEEEWCADFTSWIYKQAGYPFTGGVSGGWRIPSVNGVWDLGNQNQGFHFHSSTSDYTPRPGDLAIHKGSGVSHINIVTAVSGNTVTLIGGDQGPGPYGGPDSASIVSQITQNGFSASNTVGYVSPDN